MWHSAPRQEQSLSTELGISLKLLGVTHKKKEK